MQLFGGLRREMATFMNALSNQMFIQGREMAYHINEIVALQGNASTLPLRLQHPALRACQNELVEYLVINDEFLAHCVQFELLSHAEMVTLQNDRNPISRAKKLLFKVNQLGYGGPETLVMVLRQSGDAANALADLLQQKIDQCYEEPDQ